MNTNYTKQSQTEVLFEKQDLLGRKFMMIGQVFILVILDLIVRVVYAFQLSFRGHSLILWIWDNNRLPFYLLYLVMHDINLRLVFVSQFGYRNGLDFFIEAQSSLFDRLKECKNEIQSFWYNKMILIWFFDPK